jgi:predicted nucleic acid-binding Zn ribbon protein
MNCPKCGTWNPEDKKQCWKCDAILPMPETPKAKRRPINWFWIAVGLFILVTFMQGCWALQMRQSGPSPAPAVSYSTPVAWAPQTPWPTL